MELIDKETGDVVYQGEKETDGFTTNSALYSFIGEKVSVEKGKTYELRISSEAEEGSGIGLYCVTADSETQLLAETEAREEALGVNRYLLDALMLWCCWEEVKVRYEKQGLPVEIYYKSLEDMKWKMLECYEIHGVYLSLIHI